MVTGARGKEWTVEILERTVFTWTQSEVAICRRFFDLSHFRVANRCPLSAENAVTDV